MKVLIQCGDHHENIKRIYSLAKHLQDSGNTAIVLVYSNYAEHFFLSRGIDAISLAMKKPSQLNKLHYRFNSHKKIKGISIDDVIDCEVKRRPYILSSSRRVSTLLNAIQHVVRINTIIDEVSPDAICVWNGLTGLVANSLRLISAARGIKSFFLERGLYKDSLFIDPVGVNGFSYLSSIRQNDLGFAKTTKEIKLINNKVFVPLQVQSDTNIIYNSPFSTMREFILHVYDLFLFLGIELIVRPHPEEVDGNLCLPTLPGITYTNDFSVDYWIDNTDATITINSTVGLESLIKNKPTFSFGRSIYSNKDASIDVKNGRDIVEYIKRGYYNAISGGEFLDYIIQNHILTQDAKCTVFDNLTSSSHIEETNIKKHFNHINKSPKEYSKHCVDTFSELKEKITGKSRFHIYTDLKHSDKLNLTYRKTSEEISLPYIENSLRELFKRKIDKKNISISRTNKTSRNSVNIFLSREALCNKNSIWDLTLDRYFNVLP